MDFASDSFEIFHEDGTAVIASKGNLSGLDHPDFEAGFRLLEETLRGLPASNIVIDCGNSDFFGCSTIGLFARLKRLTSRHGGIFALCGLSPAQLEMLQVAKLDSLWPIFPSRREALEEVSNGADRG